MKDLRDPKLLGEKIIRVRGARWGMKDPAWVDETHFSPLHLLVDSMVLRVPNHNANPGPLEKYGCPLDLPETPF